MGSLRLTSAIPNCGQVRALVIKSPWSSRVFVPVARHFRASSRNDRATTTSETAAQAMKQGTNEAEKVAKGVENKTNVAASELKEEVKGAAGKASSNAQDLTEKAKQTAQDAWGSVKDTTQRIKDTVVGKAEESKEFIKENAENVKRSMNSKN